MSGETASSAEVPLTTAHAGAVGADDAEQRAVSILQRLAVFAMTFGPGSAVATYTSLFGWYQQEYHNSEILVWMRLALFAPFPIVKMMQQRYDAYFDERYSTEATYLFRLVIMQVVVSILMIIWMLLPLQLSASETVHPILIFAVLLGFCCSQFIGSSIQVAVAIDPILFVWAQLGNTIGMAVPVLAGFAFRFSPSSSHGDLCRMISVPLTVCILTSVGLAGLHYSGVFNHAYNTIARRRSLQPSNISEATPNPQDDEGVAASQDGDTQVPNLSGSSPIEVQDSQEANHVGSDATDDPHKFALWVRLWLGMQSFGIALDFFLLTLIGYFGDSDTTHDLAACTLASSAVGRLLSLPWSYLPAFKQGPMHISSAILFILRVGFWLPLMLQYFKVLHLSHGLLLPLWSSWIFLSMLHNSLTDMTVTSNVSENKRQGVAQFSVTISYSALFIGLLTASTLVLTAEGDKPSGSAPASFLSSYMMRAS